ARPARAGGGDVRVTAVIEADAVRPDGEPAGGEGGGEAAARADGGRLADAVHRDGHTATGNQAAGADGARERHRGVPSVMTVVPTALKAGVALLTVSVVSEEV